MEMNSKKLDFLCVGAEKSGTTWLVECLREHPNICMPKVKELHYFNERFVENPKIKNYRSDYDINWYMKHFKHCKKNSITGEICPAYLWDKKAPLKIKKHFPDVKIIIILRNPIDRAFSQYLYYKKRGIIREQTFEEAVGKRKDIIARSLYSKQVGRYCSLFPKKNILVLLFDDLEKNTRTFIKKIYSFLGVDNNIIPSRINEKSNVAKISRFPFINQTISKTKHFIRKNNLIPVLKIAQLSGISTIVKFVQEKNAEIIEKYPEIDAGTVKKLKKIFKSDIKKLEKLLKKDLSHWK